MEQDWEALYHANEQKNKKQKQQQDIENGEKIIAEVLKYQFGNKSKLENLPKELKKEMMAYLLSNKAPIKDISDELKKMAEPYKMGYGINHPWKCTAMTMKGKRCNNRRYRGDSCCHLHK